MITASRKPVLTEADPRLAEFARTEANRASQTVPAWLRTLRQSGISYFAEFGYPTAANEEYKYTNVAPLSQLPFAPVIAAPRHEVRPQQLKRFLFDGTPSYRLVFVDGHFAASLSDVGLHTDGLKLDSVAQALDTEPELLERHLAHYARATDQPFLALNAAFFQDGAFIVLPPGKVVREPIHLLHIATRPEVGTATHTRNLILAQANSQATIIEEYIYRTDSVYVTNAVTEIVLSEGAHLEHVRLQNEHPKAFHIGMVKARQERDSDLLSHSITLGAGLSRQDIHNVLDADGGHATFNGLYLARGKQLVDHHTVMDHAKPHCDSHEFYHGILMDQAKGVFNGKIFVRPQAQKTNAKQTNRNLILSEEATVDTKPQLEIFADDVKCTHGATVGQLNEEALFYLRSRGIGLEQSRQMLIHAFALEILERITLDSVRERIDQLVLDWLKGQTESGKVI